MDEWGVAGDGGGVWTTVLRPGDVLFGHGHHGTVIEVRGVRFELRHESMVDPVTYTALGEYWRTGDLRP
ncbi:hypothetical protein [Nocardia miyunensis]|uniref:hypothetical protein n=1 Tax=Nocardia miyunensis TaxID=282684 RepID=UPI0008329502|nr:hypothetical protein [Nocardia miyunensis]